MSSYAILINSMNIEVDDLIVQLDNIDNAIDKAKNKGNIIAK